MTAPRPLGSHIAIHPSHPALRPAVRRSIRALLVLVLAASACTKTSSGQGGLPGQAAAGLAKARHWKSDAELVAIEAQDYARNGRLMVTFRFYSPSSGAGLWIVHAPEQGDQMQEAGSVNWGTRPIPAEFLDLPAAIAEARRSGMGPAVDHAILRAGTDGAYWEITPPFNAPGSRVYRVAAGGQPPENPSGQVEALLARGQTAAMNREFDAAIADLTTVIRLDPKRQEAYDARGQSYLMKERYDEAEADFTKALQLNPKDDIAHWKLGDIYSHRGDHERAIESFTRSIESGGDESKVLTLRAREYEALGRRDAALADLQRAVQLDPDLPEAREELERVEGRAAQ